MYEESNTHYVHTQNGPWCFVLLGVALFTLGIAWPGRSATPAVLISGSVALLMAALAASFRYLRTSDEGDRLAVRFGPIPLFGMSIYYNEITGVEVDRTLLLDGWGIHYSPRGGWVWNIWGRDCVAIRRGEKIVRVGTDDPEGLAAFLRKRAGLS